MKVLHFFPEELRLRRKCKTFPSVLGNFEYQNIILASFRHPDDTPFNERDRCYIVYAVYRTREFEKQFTKQLSAEEQNQVENFERNQFIHNPYVGDILSYPFLREKKVGAKRVYFLIYEKFKNSIIGCNKQQKATTGNN